MFELICIILSFAFVIIAVRFFIEVPQTLNRIESNIEITNSLIAEQMHVEALKEADISRSN